MLYYNVCVSCMYYHVYLSLVVMICRTAVINLSLSLKSVVAIAANYKKTFYNQSQIEFILFVYLVTVDTKLKYTMSYFFKNPISLLQEINRCLIFQGIKS